MYKRINEPLMRNDKVLYSIGDTSNEIIGDSNNWKKVIKSVWDLKNAVKYLDKNDWKIDDVKYSKRYHFGTKDTVIQTERAIDKLRKIIEFESLKKGTLEKSCIDDELYLLGDYGFYYNGFGDWFFGKTEKIVTISKKMNYYTFEMSEIEDVRYRVSIVEKLTNQNYKILLDENDV